jgi:hypothetical protein
MRFSASTALLFTLCTLPTCIFLKLTRESGADTLQLTLFGAVVAVAREFLSRRLGCTVDLYAIMAAAAPLDYILNKGSPSWQLLGVGPCDKRRHEQGRFGGCVALQASVCYRYGASGKLDWAMMEGCYRALGVGAGDAERHFEQCHSDADLPLKGFESCLTASMDWGNRTGRSVDLPVVVLACMGRYGVEEEFADLTAKMEGVEVKKVGNSTEGDGLAERHMKCAV